MSEPQICPFMKCLCNQGHFKIKDKVVKCRKWEWLIKPHPESNRKGHGKCTAVVIKEREE